MKQHSFKKQKFVRWKLRYLREEEEGWTGRVDQGSKGRDPSLALEQIRAGQYSLSCDVIIVGCSSQTVCVRVHAGGEGTTGEFQSVFTTQRCFDGTGQVNDEAGCSGL